MIRDFYLLNAALRKNYKKYDFILEIGLTLPDRVLDQISRKWKGVASIGSMGSGLPSLYRFNTSLRERCGGVRSAKRAEDPRRPKGGRGAE
jgi:hypothetical protein